MNKIRLAGIIENSTVDGPGFRTVVFVQGCPHHCPGCHNPQTWSCDGGTLAYIKDVAEIIMKNPYCTAITLSGGEPLMQADALLQLLDEFESAGKTYHIMTFTGYSFEDIQQACCKSAMELISRSDLVVDGPFLENEKSFDLYYRGSRNQRILLGKESVMLGEPVLASIGDQQQKSI